MKTFNLLPPRPWPGLDGSPGAYLHANQRLRERYGLDITQAEYAALCRELWEAGPLTKTTVPRVVGICDHDRQVIRLRLRGTTVTAIWKQDDGVIVTFLPPHGHAFGTEKAYEDKRKRKKSRKGRWQ